MEFIESNPERRKYLIGKDAGCEIVLAHQSISKRHCTLIVTGDGTYFLSDMGSTYGVFVKKDGSWVRIKDAEVGPADIVRIGAFEVPVSTLLLQLQALPKTTARPKDKIFISYRRADTEQVAGRIFDRLAAEYGADKVFFDTDAIPGAVDFRANVQVAIQQSAVLLAIIGRNWFLGQRGPSLLRKLFGERSSQDFVQSELEAALQWTVTIIPLLVDGASMPSPKSLPEAVRELAFLNAITVRGGRDFAMDMAAVQNTVARYLPRPPEKLHNDPFK